MAPWRSPVSCRIEGLNQELPSHWQLGPRVYEATQCRLSRRGQPVDLTPSENRLLWRLCRARLESPGEGLHARALGQAAGVDDDSSARHHLNRLRDKVGNEVLDHDRSNVASTRLRNHGAHRGRC
jgi:DNA-binding response OmpR family regulator